MDNELDVYSCAVRIGFCLMIFVGITPAVHAQPSSSFSMTYDVFPYQHFADPKIDGQGIVKLSARLAQ